MSLTTPYDDQNIFAKILRKELPCVKVFEDDGALAFMDIFPQTEGHTLVIPKHEKATNIFDIAPDKLGALIISTQRIAVAVHKALRPDGVRLIQFNGTAAGQTVFHIHFHVLPIYAGAEARPHAGGGKADPSALEAIAARIRASI